MKIGILGDSESYYAKELLAAAKRAEIAAECFSFMELSATLKGNEAVVSERRLQTTLDEADAILVRSMPLGSLEQVIFRMDCLQAAEANGVLLINRPKTLEIAIDKWLTLHRLAIAGLPVPATIACQTREQAMEAWEMLGGDVVVKPIFGGEGRGVMRVSDKDLAWRVFSVLQQTRSVHYLQEFLPHFGYDIRVLLIGDRCFSIRREADIGQWKTNVAQGSRPLPNDLSPEHLELALQAADALGSSIVNGARQRILGIDLLPCNDGKTRVLEVNAVPGWRGLQKALDVSIADETLGYVKQLIQLTNN